MFLVQSEITMVDIFISLPQMIKFSKFWLIPKYVNPEFVYSKKGLKDPRWFSTYQTYSPELNNDCTS